MSRYKHLFFDLDHTLWDFQGNSRATLRELFETERLMEAGVSSAEEFIDTYEEINHALWAKHSAGVIPKEVLRALRFREALGRFGVKDNRLAQRLEHEYLARCPLRSLLMPGALEVLTSLHGRYRMHIITNGFDEVQGIKLNSAGITHFFDVVLTSERAGAAKPSPVIFQSALHRTNATAETSLMIGDNIDADMHGARQAGWDHVHYAAACERDPLATHSIAHWKEFEALLDR
ncbi:MAG TPA: YjjG family noncanonical pyrimidine nucleotidase [Flavobacteriales bacterium]|nr:YjjG family noncanonical pyrimidine nucleotidase [Flavobacteriales bacterium]